MGFKFKFKRTRRSKKPSVSKGVKRYVSRKINNMAEDKIQTVSLPAVFGSLTTAWTEQGMANPAQGISKVQRIGNKIKVKSIEISGILSQGSNEAATDDAWNVIRIVIGKYSMGAATPLQTAGIVMNDPIKKDYNNARGLLLNKYMDTYIPLEVASTEQGAGDGYTPALRKIKYYKRFSNFTVNWNDAGVNYPDKQLIISMLSDSVAVTNPGFVAGYMLVRYEDA